MWFFKKNVELIIDSITYPEVVCYFLQATFEIFRSFHQKLDIINRGEPYVEKRKKPVLCSWQRFGSEQFYKVSKIIATETRGYVCGQLRRMEDIFEISTEVEGTIMSEAAANTRKLVVKNDPIHDI